MTVDDLVTRACIRIGDTTPDFAADVAQYFPDVMRDLAQRECLTMLRLSASFDVIAGQTQYDTQTVTGLSDNNWPIYIERLLVLSWGSQGVVPNAENNEQFEMFQSDAGNTQGIWRLWRQYPNESVLEVTPAADADHSGAGKATAIFRGIVGTYDGDEEPVELRDEDSETVIWGLMARACEHSEQLRTFAPLYWAEYKEGAGRMYARAHNRRRPGRIKVTPF